MKKLILLLFIGIQSIWVWGQTILTVTNADMNSPGSFQEAIDSAVSVATGTVIIQFTDSVSGTIESTGGNFTVPTSIYGPGRDNVVISSAGFSFNDSATIKDLSFTSSHIRLNGNTGNFPLLNLENVVLADYQSRDPLHYSVVQVMNGSLVMDSCITRNNTTLTRGGGLQVIGTPQESTVIIRNSVFEENMAANRGGGIYVEDSNLEIENSIIRSNEIDPGIFMDYSHKGGGIFFRGPTNQLIMNKCNITGNKIHTVPGQSSEIWGGGIYIQGAFTLDECILQNNTISTLGDPIDAFGGGLAYSSQNTMNVITKSSIIDNSSERDGGGILGIGPVQIANTTISGNRSLFGTSALVLSNGAFEIDFCTITNNHFENTQDGFAVRMLGASSDGDPTPVSITNTIFTGNTSNHPSGYSGDLELTGSFSYTAVFNNLFSAIGSHIFPELNIITTDPNDWGLEQLADNGGFTPTHALLPNSLAINAADSTVSGGSDQRGAPRVLGGRADIGAFERSGAIDDTEPPSAPVLAVDSLMEFFVKLSWTASTDNVGVIRYAIFQDTTLVGSTDSLEFLVTGLEPCGEYRFTVIASDEAGNQTTSNEVAVFTDATPPEVPVLEDIISCQLVRLPHVFAFDICDGDTIRGVAEGFIGKEPGTYPIEWSFTDNHGNTSMVSQQVIITGPPSPEFISPPAACPGDSVTFIDISTNVHPQATYLWDFGDSTISTKPGDVTHTYTNGQGLYEVSLTISQGGCEAIFSDFYAPILPPILTLEIANEISAPGAMDGAIDLTVFGKGTFQYLWSNGEVTEDISGLGEGVYHVLVTNQLGCTAEDSISLVDPEGGCFSTDIVAFSQGKKKNGRPVSKRRSDPTMALGQPQENDTFNFVSLGFGGSITLKLETDLYDDGSYQPDFILVETSFGRADQMCFTEGSRNYPEMAFIEVSSDNEEWVSLPNAMCRTSFVDIGPAIQHGLPFVRYIRITDASNKTWFGRHADGIDIDGVITCREEVSLAFERLTNARTTSGGDMAFDPDFINLVTDEEDELTFNIFPNPIIGSVLKIAYETEDELQGNIRVVDIMGKAVMTQEFHAKPQQKQLMVHTDGLQSGIYILQILQNGEVAFATKIQKQ